MNTLELTEEKIAIPEKTVQNITGISAVRSLRLHAQYVLTSLRLVY